MGLIALHGFYGYGNLGDEAILWALQKEIEERNNKKVIVFSDGFKDVKEHYGITCCPVTGRRYLLKQLWYLWRSNCVILGGGGLLKDYGGSSANVEKWLSVINKAMRLRKKTVLCSMGVENICYETSKKVIKDVLNQIDVITVRDAVSKEVLQACGVEKKIKVISDPVLLITDQTEVRDKPEGGLKILVCVRHWYDKDFSIEDQKKNDQFLNALAETCDVLQDQYKARITFIPMRTVSHDDDRIVMKEVVSRMKQRKGVVFQDDVLHPWDFKDIVFQQDLVLGMRLHSLIFAASLGIPMIGLEYMPKVAGFMESIKQKDFSLDMSCLTKERMLEAVTKTYESYRERSEHIVEKVKEWQNLTRETIHNIVRFSQDEVSQEEV